MTGHGNVKALEIKSCNNCHWFLNEDDGECEDCSRRPEIKPDNWTPKEPNTE